MYRDEFKNLPLSDRFMFGEVMRNSGICKLFLEELLQCKIERIVFAAKEADLSDTVLGHGIRLDVFLADENNTHYDVEMQNTSDSIEKRSRYYQSVIDRELLKRSMDYDKLPESFIIFICNFDHVGKGLAKYERVSYYKGTDDEYNDGSHVILLNTRYTDRSNVSDSIAEYLDYIRDNNDTANFSTMLAQEAVDLTQKVRHDPEKEVDFVTFRMALMDERRAAHKEGREEGIKEGIREGRQEGRIETFCDLVAKGVLTVAEALNLSGCTKGEFTEWMQKLYPNFKT